MTKNDILYVVACYARLENMEVICNALRKTPNIDPVIIYTGADLTKLKQISKEIKIVAVGNEHICLARHLAIKKLVTEFSHYKYVMLIDDDVIPEPELVDFHLKAMKQKTIIAGWGFYVVPPFNNYWNRIKMENNCECHYCGGCVVLYSAEFFKELVFGGITKEMALMDDIWISYQAHKMGYRVLGTRKKYWRNQNEGKEALWTQLKEKKVEYWRKLFSPDFYVKITKKINASFSFKPKMSNYLI